MTYRYTQWSLSLSCAALLALAACANPSPPTNTASQPSSPNPSDTGQAIVEPDSASTSASDAATEFQTSFVKIKFKHDDGNDAFSLKPKADGAKLVDANNQELARFTLDENGKVKIKDTNDSVLGYVIIENGYWKIEDARQTQALFILRAQEDGDYKLEDGNDTQLYRIKQRDYGYEVETPAKESLYKIKLKAEQLSLRDANDMTVIATKAPMLPLAMVCFGLDALDPAQQAALAYAVNLSGRQ
ncbi:MAG: hypothetical protein AAFX01_02225 [Cyanobacteria bacterium J06638_28]